MSAQSSGASDPPMHQVFSSPASPHAVMPPHSNGDAAALEPPHKLLRKTRKLAMTLAFLHFCGIFGHEGLVFGGLSSLLSCKAARATRRPNRTHLGCFRVCATLIAVLTSLVFVTSMGFAYTVVSCACSDDCTQQLYDLAQEQAALIENATLSGDNGGGRDASTGKWAGDLSPMGRQRALSRSSNYWHGRSHSPRDPAIAAPTAADLNVGTAFNHPSHGGVAGDWAQHQQPLPDEEPQYESEAAAAAEASAAVPSSKWYTRVFDKVRAVSTPERAASMRSHARTWWSRHHGAAGNASDWVAHVHGHRGGKRHHHGDDDDDGSASSSTNSSNRRDGAWWSRHHGAAGNASDWARSHSHGPGGHHLRHSHHKKNHHAADGDAAGGDRAGWLERRHRQWHAQRDAAGEEGAAAATVIAAPSAPSVALMTLHQRNLEDRVAGGMTKNGPTRPFGVAGSVSITPTALAMPSLLPLSNSVPTLTRHRPRHGGGRSDDEDMDRALLQFVHFTRNMSLADFQEHAGAVCDAGPRWATLIGGVLLIWAAVHIAACSAARKLGKHPWYVAQDELRLALKHGDQDRIAAASAAVQGRRTVSALGFAHGLPQPGALYTFVQGQGFVLIGAAGAAAPYPAYEQQQQHAPGTTIAATAVSPTGDLPYAQQAQPQPQQGAPAFGQQSAEELGYGYTGFGPRGVLTPFRWSPFRAVREAARAARSGVSPYASILQPRQGYYAQVNAAEPPAHGAAPTFVEMAPAHLPTPPSPGSAASYAEPGALAEEQQALRGPTVYAAGPAGYPFAYVQQQQQR